MDETTTLPEALSLVEQAKGMIQDLESLLPHSLHPSFRERLVDQLENLEHLKDTIGQDDSEFQRKASELLDMYEKVFGVKDVVETPTDA